jgi:hypothetical protein
MSDEQHIDPELPLWVQDIVAAAEERAYARGWEEGQKQLWYTISGVVERARPYGA